MITEEQIIQIAHEYAAKGPKQLARELGITYQVITNVVANLRRRGVRIPKHRINRYPYDKVAARLLAEQKQKE
jgi:predicted transcriptional regulator